MCRLFLLECKRALINIKVLLSVLLLAILLFYNFDGSNVIQCLDFISLRFSFIAIILAIASAVYSESICEDFEYKYVRSIWLRICMYKYVICKAAVCFVSSAFTFMSGYLISLWLLIKKIGMPDNEQIMYSFEINNPTLYKKFQGSDTFVLYALLIGIHIAVLTGVMSLIAIYVSTYINNKLFLIMAPNAILIISDMVLQRVFGMRLGATLSLYSFGTIGLTSPVVGMKIWMYYVQIIIWSVVLICLLIKRCDKMVE